MKSDHGYKLIDLFFREKGLARQHIESFNYFISQEIHDIVRTNQIVDSDIDPTFYLKYLNVRVGLPSQEENMVKYNVFPMECRLRDLTYSGNIYVDVEYVRNKQIVIKRDVFIGKMPIMLRSKWCHIGLASEKSTHTHSETLRMQRESQECPLDIGGYFVIRGQERVILIQEQLSKKRINIEQGIKGPFASVTSYTHEQKSKTSIIYKNDSFYLKNTIFSEEISIMIVIKALGMLKEKEVMEFIGYDLQEIMAPSFGEVLKSSIFTERQAQLFLSSHIRIKPDADPISEIRSILSEKVLPNVKISNANFRKKAIFVCLMIRRLALVITGRLEMEDKDFLGNKRFELAGQLLALLFEDTFKGFNFELKKSIDKILSKRSRAQEFDALTFLNLQANSVTSALLRAIATGNWNLKRFRMERSGVTHVVTRHSYISAIGMMTKISSHFEKTRKVSGPRALHTSSWGMLCPADTPEGEACGLVKNLSILAEITTDTEIKPILDIVFGFGVIDITTVCSNEIHDAYLVYINGDVVGFTNRPVELLKYFRLQRRKNKVHRFVSIYEDNMEKTINISADNGRVCRPLIVINHNRIEEVLSKKAKNDIPLDISPAMENTIGCCKTDTRNISTMQEEYGEIARSVVLLEEEDFRYKTFSELVDEGYIEYLDANEENDALIALNPSEITRNHTHMEIADFAILGYVAGLIPFPHHNQSPRNTYQCAMGKQAIGYIGLNSMKRFDGLTLQLNYLQRPLVSTKILDIIKYNQIPAGQNAMVTVMSYSGYDLEDAFILNQASIDRGFGRVDVYRSDTVVLKKYSNGLSDVLLSNQYNRQGGMNNGGELQGNVLDSDGICKPGAILEEGETYINKFSPVNGSYKFTGRSHKGKRVIVDRVLVTKSQDQVMVKTVLREHRRPELGDKFSSRHGQKGVVGLIVPQVDMPFNEQGLVPDIIMNPHGFPSRMTVGKIIELLTGKAGSLSGEISDSTAFKENEVEATCKVLMDSGFSYSGKDCFTSGTTGAPLSAYIFYGPVFYQRLKHMVADKMHMRARGPRAVLTRQPTEGRSNDGGLRVGEMERDCLIGYGASSLIVERLMISSDVFEAYICRQCGILCYKGCCSMCKSSNPVAIKMPYACKLLFQELMSMNIFPKLHIE